MVSCPPPLQPHKAHVGWLNSTHSDAANSLWRVFVGGAAITRGWGFVEWGDIVEGWVGKVRWMLGW